MDCTRLKAAALAALFSAAAGAVHAQSAADLLAAAVMAAPADKALELSTPRDAFAPRYTGDKPVRIPGISKTAVDRQLDRDLTGSLGFLCGLQPGADKTGAGATRGYDPTGRFVGAKLSLAFR